MIQQHGFPEMVIKEDLRSLAMTDLKNCASESGELFQTFDKFTIVAGATRQALFITPSDKQIRFFPAVIVCSADKLTYKVSEGTTATGGTAVTPINHDRTSDKVSGVLLKTGPTVTLVGTQIAQSYLPGSTGIGQTRSGASAGGETFWKFKPDTTYLIELVNGSSEANDVQINIIWVEVPL